MLHSFTASYRERNEKSLEDGDIDQFTRTRPRGETLAELAKLTGSLPGRSKWATDAAWIDMFRTKAIAGHFFEKYWWARQDLNLGPTDYESAALTS